MLVSHIGFPVYVTRINMFDALVDSGPPQYEHAEVRRIHRHETLWCTKCETLPNFSHENWAPLLRYLGLSMGRANRVWGQIVT